MAKEYGGGLGDNATFDGYMEVGLNDKICMPRGKFGETCEDGTLLFLVFHCATFCNI